MLKSIPSLLPILTAFGLAACGQAEGSPKPAAAPDHAIAGIASAAAPVVVELFQSQGCSSCPPANANINAIADEPGVLALSFGVTYWDQLGWKDTFASPQFTQRQWDYAHYAQRGGVSTPQVIVDGGSPIVGSDRQELDRTIRSRGAARGGPEIKAEKGRITLGQAGGGYPALVWLVRYDPKVRNVPIRAGENDGRTLPHRNIVRELTKLGSWSGRVGSFALTVSKEAGLSTAVVVQQGFGGPIIAARKL